MSVRIGAPPPPMLVTAVARLGVPDVLNFPARTNLGYVVAQRCGLIDPTYIGILLKENPELKDTDIKRLPKRMRIVLPACLKAPRPSKVKVQRGDTLQTIAARYGINLDVGRFAAGSAWTPCRLSDRSCRPSDQFISIAQQPKYDALKSWGYGPSAGSASGGGGRYGDTQIDFPKMSDQTHAFIDEHNSQFVFQRNPDVDPNKLKEGSNLVLPNLVPSWASIQLRPGVSAASAKSEIKLAAATVTNADAGLIVGDPQPQAQLIGRVLASPNDSQCVAPAQGSKLFDSSVLIKWLNDYHDHFEGEPTPTTILVLDTGFDDPGFVGNEIPQRYIQKTGGLVDPYAVTTFSRFTGVNFATKENDPKTFERDPERWHGLSVSGVALGGREIEDTRRAVLLPVRLSFANMERSSGAGVVIDPDSLARSLTYALENKISVINVSLELFQRGDWLAQSMMRVTDNVLVVAAAGNDGKDVGNPSDKRWPALFGGAPTNGSPGIFVTVAAEDGDHKIATFSRRAANFVDLLAPGCDVPSYTAEVATNKHYTIHPAKVSGTSFGAPLVSFVSALLIADNLRPAQVKTRLLASVDVQDPLRTVAYSSGRLNVARALAIFDDAIETSDQKGPRFGKLQNKNDQNVVQICGESILATRLLKLAIDDRDGGGRYAYLWLRGQDPVNKPLAFERRESCQIQPTDTATLLFQENGKQDAETISLATLRDYTPSM
jgi:hypothetical protein